MVACGWTMEVLPPWAGSGVKLMPAEWHGAARFGDVLAAWRDDVDAALKFAAVLASLNYEAAYWECPRLTEAALSRGFECVVLPAPQLATRRANSAAFADRFGTFDEAETVVYFANLSSDGTLVVPRPIAGHAGFAHLLALLRQAPAAIISAFLRVMAAQALRACEHGPVWMSTAGDAVPWVHGRLDSLPKYYRYLPYRRGA